MAVTDQLERLDDIIANSQASGDVETFAQATHLKAIIRQQLAREQAFLLSIHKQIDRANDLREQAIAALEFSAIFKPAPKVITLSFLS